MVCCGTLHGIQVDYLQIGIISAASQEAVFVHSIWNLLSQV
jgi:hypothetical protein